MKKLSLIILLLCMGFNNTHAQQYFNNRNSNNSFRSFYTNVIERFGKYYCVGASVDSSNHIGGGQYNYINGIRFVIYDSIGNKLRDTFYQRHDTIMVPWQNSMHSLPNGDFIVPVETGTDSFAFNTIVRIDSLGNEVAHYDIPLPFCGGTASTPTDLQPTGTGEWIMLSSLVCGNQSDPVLTKLDSNFNVIWYKHLNLGNTIDFFDKILVEPDGYLLAGGKNNSNVTSNNFMYRAWLLKTDTAGIQQWQWLSHQDSLTGSAKDVIRTQDGGLVYCGLGAGYEHWVNSSWGVMFFKAWIEKIDNNGNVVWNHALSPIKTNMDFHLQTVLKELPDGSIIVSGSIVGGFGQFDTLDQNFGSLIKIDPSGTILWKHLYTAVVDKYAYKVHDMKQTEDGGFVLVGEANDYYGPQPDPRNQSWIIKIDSNGCDQGVGLCNPANVKEQIKNTAQIKTYPNPAGDILHVESNEAVVEYRLISITGIVQFNGRLNEGRNTLDISKLTSGLYILQAGSEVIKLLKD